MNKLFEVDGGQAINDDHKLEWPDTLVLYMTRDKALRMLVLLSNQLAYGSESHVSFDFCGEFQEAE